ncbi:hypothetical protein ACP4OV_004431 [Aristida adscensionis]
MAIVDRRAARRAAAVFLLVCAAARAASAISNGPLMNGNFEYPPNKWAMNGSVVTGENAIPYWKTSGYMELIGCGQKQGDMILTVPEGQHAVRLGNDASISQQLSVTRGSYYSFTFSASRTCSQDEKLRVSIIPGTQDGELPIQTVYTSCGWDSYSWAFIAESGLVTLTIHHDHGDDDDPACGPVVDAIAIKELHPPYATQDNLLKNGDFEEGPYIPESSPWGTLVPPKEEDDVSPLPGWKIMSFSKGVKYIDRQHFAVPKGNYAVELVSGAEAAIMQEADTPEGGWYKLSFIVGDAGNGCAASSDTSPMQVRANAGREGTVVKINSQGSGGSQYAEFVFQAASSKTNVVFVSLGTHTKNDNSGTLCGPVIDAVKLVATSQPQARRLLL